MVSLECFAGPADGSVVEIQKEAVGALIIHNATSSQPERHWYRRVTDGKHYLHYCDEHGRLANARRP